MAADTDPAPPPLRPTEGSGAPFRDLPGRLREAAALRPDRVALLDGDATLTHAALARRMDRIAARLRADGLRPGDVVATLAELTADHVALYLGIAAAGGAVAPLPLSATPEALGRMAANARPRRILADGAGPPLPGAEPLAAFLAAAEATEPLPPVPLAPDMLLDVIYSSGTTGAPKGIEHDHLFRDRQVDRFRGYGLGPDAVALVSTPLYSNTTLAFLLPALGQAARVVLLRRFGEEAFLRAAERHRATHAMLVPVQIARLLAHPEFDRHDLGAFQAKLCTSAPLPAPLIREALQRWPGRMINIYGLTEGGLSAVLDAGAYPGKLHTVGRPVPGAEIRVIDPEGRALPPGETGEVVGRAPTVMRGYRDAPEATAAAIWVSPEGDSFLRSGDMGRLDADGFLELRDRLRDVIVSGGFNVFASDLEAALLAHPAVAEAAAFALPSPRWGETPAACVALRPGRTDDPAAILAQANGRLGRMQRISALAVVPALPRSAIGKVLRRELRDRWARGEIAPAAARADV